MGRVFLYVHFFCQQLPGRAGIILPLEGIADQGLAPQGRNMAVAAGVLFQIPLMIFLCRKKGL